MMCGKCGDFFENLPSQLCNHCYNMSMNLKCDCSVCQNQGNKK